jgi:hypothetical protein
MEGEYKDHPDIDSVLQMHIGSDSVSYKTRVINDETEHKIMHLKKGGWTPKFSIDHEELKTFNDDEKVTYLIHKFLMNRAIGRRMVLLFILFLAFAIPVLVYTVVVLGVEVTDDFEKFLIIGGLIVPFIPLFCFVMSSAERSIDSQVYCIRSNFIEVLKKMKDASEHDFQIQAFENRIQRILSNYG